MKNHYIYESTFFKSQNKTSHPVRKIIALGVTSFILLGIYNSVVINSSSTMSDTSSLFVRRLDEMNGVFIPGRKIAGFLPKKKIIKLTPKKKIVVFKKKIFKKDPSPQITQTEVPSVLDGDISLNLSEVTNGKKWKNGLEPSDFSGRIYAKHNLIDSLEVSINGHPTILAEYSELEGNVFSYEIANETHSGLLYQVDQDAYIINLTSGPLEGTRLRFSNTQPSNQEDRDYLAENNITPGSFGDSENQQNEYAQNQEEYDTYEAYPNEETEHVHFDKEMQNEGQEVNQYENV